MRITHVAEMSDPDRGPHRREKDALDDAWREVAARDRQQARERRQADPYGQPVIVDPRLAEDHRGLVRGLTVVVVLYAVVTAIVVVMSWGAR